MKVLIFLLILHYILSFILFGGATSHIFFNALWLPGDFIFHIPLFLAEIALIYFTVKGNKLISFTYALLMLALCVLLLTSIYNMYVAEELMLMLGIALAILGITSFSIMALVVSRIVKPIT